MRAGSRRFRPHAGIDAAGRASGTWIVARLENDRSSRHLGTMGQGLIELAALIALDGPDASIDHGRHVACGRRDHRGGH
jgi:hypothetical protein